jgi:hypothetical protein
MLRHAAKHLKHWSALLHGQHVSPCVRSCTWAAAARRQAPAWPRELRPHQPGKAPLRLPAGLREPAARAAAAPAGAGAGTPAVSGPAVRRALAAAAAALAAAAPHLDELDGRWPHPVSTAGSHASPDFGWGFRRLLQEAYV